MSPIEFIWKVLLLCYKWDGSVTSWIRTQKHNHQVGGVINSLHMVGLGCDVVFDWQGGDLEIQQDCKNFGLKALWEGDHWHLQPLNI